MITPQVSQDNDGPVAIARNNKIADEGDAKPQQMIATGSCIHINQNTQFICYICLKKLIDSDT